MRQSIWYTAAVLFLLTFKLEFYLFHNSSRPVFFGTVFYTVFLFCLIVCLIVCLFLLLIFHYGGVGGFADVAGVLFLFRQRTNGAAGLSCPQ